MQVNLVMLFDETYSRVGVMTSNRLKEYAQTHLYSVEIRTRLPDIDRHPSWNKLLVVGDSLGRDGVDWVMWLDADVVVMNLDIQIENLLDDQADIIFASDNYGLCAGVFIARNCAWTKQFLETALFLGDINYDPDGLGCKWEQNTFKHLLRNFDDISSHVKIHPHRAMNSSLHTYQPGDFILHLHSMSNEERLRMLHDVCGLS